jgi:hypothetical protein
VYLGRQAEVMRVLGGCRAFRGEAPAFCLHGQTGMCSPHLRPRERPRFGLQEVAVMSLSLEKLGKDLLTVAKIG